MTQLESEKFDHMERLKRQKYEVRPQREPSSRSNVMRTFKRPGAKSLALNTSNEAEVVAISESF